MRGGRGIEMVASREVAGGDREHRRRRRRNAFRVRAIGDLFA